MLHDTHKDGYVGIGTDTSQICICDEKYFKGFEDQDWYGKCCDAGHDGCGYIPHGFVIRTGADGGYGVRLREADGKVVGLVITFYYC